MVPSSVSALKGTASTAGGVQREASSQSIRLRSETLDSGRVRHTVIVDGRAISCRGHFSEVRCSVVACAALWWRVIDELAEAHDASVTVGG